ncbi:MAG: PadR family transcriptional regulator, partial [Conexivisphaerales archaeon]|nr:PadR family transcriptional regulator [Conexivisphaerales archaeon]
MVKTGKNFLNKGIIKLLILDSLYDKEAHGYEVIKKIGQKFHGIYEPSPGIIYPTLEFLVDQELVNEKVVNGKKVYYITEKGKKVRDDGLQALNSFLNKKIQPNERVKVIDMILKLRSTIYEKLYSLDDKKLKELY